MLYNSGKKLQNSHIDDPCKKNLQLFISHKFDPYREDVGIQTVAAGIVTVFHKDVLEIHAANLKSSKDIRVIEGYTVLFAGEFREIIVGSIEFLSGKMSLKGSEIIDLILGIKPKGGR